MRSPFDPPRVRPIGIRSAARPAGPAFVLLLGLASHFPALAVSSSAGETSSSPPPDYAGTVAAILHARCAECHRPGGIAPMSFLSYDEARPWAKSIRRSVESREMPPWHPDPAHGEWANDMSLSAEEIDAIVRWVDAGAPAGDLALAPAPPTFEAGWRLGEPDLVIDLPPYTVPAGGPDILFDHVVKAEIPRGSWLSGVEFLPGDLRVVHHITGYVGNASMNGPGGAAAAFSPTVKVFVIWAGGQPPLEYPDGVGHRLSPRQIFTFNMHYHPVEHEEVVDVTRVGLHFGVGEIERACFNVSAASQSLLIPPGESNYERSAFYQFAADSQIVSLFPHMHYRGKDMTYVLALPDGERRTLLRVPKYSFGWQRVYYPKEPIDAPKGSRLEMVAHFDNSAANPDNPDPTAWVRTGEQTNDEMGIAFFDFVSKDSVEPAPLEHEAYLAEVMAGYPAGDGYVLKFGGGALPAGAAAYLPRDRDTGTLHLTAGFNLFTMDLRDLAWEGDRFTCELVMGDSVRGSGEVSEDGSVAIDFHYSEEAKNDPLLGFGVRLMSHLEGRRVEAAEAGVAGAGL